MTRSYGWAFLLAGEFKTSDPLQKIQSAAEKERGTLGAEWDIQTPSWGVPAIAHIQGKDQ